METKLLSLKDGEYQILNEEYQVGIYKGFQDLCKALAPKWSEKP